MSFPDHAPSAARLTKTLPAGIEALRGPAEARLRQAPAKAEAETFALTPDAGQLTPQRLLHELQVRHVELEIQNEELRQQHDSLRLAAKVFEHSYDAIMVTDANNLILDVNPAFSRITGYARAAVIGRSPELLSSGLNPAELLTQRAESLRQHDFWSGELWSRRHSGEVYAEAVSVSVVRGEGGEAQQYVSVSSDISRLKRHEAELDRIANYDLLTGLPNRRLFFDRLKQAMARSDRSGETLAICFLDLDGFKLVNDRFGHAAGDAMLVEITQRLGAVMRGEDTVARLGGDEFVLLADLGAHIDRDALLTRLLDSISAPHTINGETVAVSGSIGVTFYPDDKADAETLLRHADHAMYEAKSKGKNRFELFDLAHSLHTEDRFQQLARLRQALLGGEFRLVYQPKVDLVSGAVLGAEALIRWAHPERGLLPPASFLSHLDGTSLELEVGEWVIATALAQLDQWRRAGWDFVVSVNIAPQHLLQPQFTDRLAALLAAAPEVAPDRLELEILESTALTDMQRAANALQSCRELGVRFALDDFGTGYSSLSYFRSLPVHTLKIDQSFVQDMLQDPNDRAIVEAVLRLADTFGREVVAEGVETQEHGHMLLGMGCRVCQGYGIARPLPPEAFGDWAKAWQHNRPWSLAA